MDIERTKVWSWGLSDNATSPKDIPLLLVFNYIISFFDKKAYKIAEYTHSNATQQFKTELEQVKDIL
ncbi:hypothetical protein [Spiroplasma endosymbiont of Polydrusus formosus]|uniref:hypothetical protein n=1 Tax=Spiroplasma endosymbiont of Polydrusus formosus TaxID=3139326 RepID=UPI0035B55217